METIPPPRRSTTQSATARQPPVVVIGGPTASGKSALALGLAEALDGVVINADSLQVYRDLAVLTARPGPAELARAPHRLYGILPAGERCSAALWREWALAEIAAARRAGRRPILVGGTGLYIKALMEGLAPVPSVPEAVRAAAKAHHAALGGTAFHAALARRDPAMAARLKPGDTQRLIRAWEVLEATGRSLADWQAAAPEPPPSGLRFDLHVLAPPRDALYAACDARFLQMIEAGAPEEVRALAALGLDPGLPVMKALGVPELLAHLRGALTLDEAIRLGRLATRHYAKRQLTWFRHQTPAPGGCVHNSHVHFGQLSESFLQEILTFIREND